MERELLGKLKRLGIIHETAVLDDVLDLTIEDVLERRLQTMVFRKGLANSFHHARQLVTHGHISIGERRVTSPSYLVTRQDENQVSYASKSPLINPEHPIRQMMKVGATEEKAEETLTEYMKMRGIKGYSVERVLKIYLHNFKDPRDTERFAEGLRLAGLPMK